MPNTPLGTHRTAPMFPRFDTLPMTMIANIKFMGDIIRDNIRQHTPKRTWYMYGRCKVISTRVTRYTGRVRVGWKKSDFPRGKFYAVWVGEGTGVHGDRHRRITSKKAKKGKKPFIRYQYKGDWVTKKSTEGIKPREMLELGYGSSVAEIMQLASRTAFTFFRVSKRA